MTVKHILALLAAACLFTAGFSDLAAARGRHGGHHHCGAHKHLDYGTLRCVKNH